MHLKSCLWRWDYKSRVATSLKLFISHVIALLPPGYLNSLLYLSLWMKSSHLKIVTASSVPCPEMTTHTFLHLYFSTWQKKAQAHLLRDPDTEKLFIFLKSFRPHQFLHCFPLGVLGGASRLCHFSARFPIAFGDKALLNTSLLVARAGHSGSGGSSAGEGVCVHQGMRCSGPWTCGKGRGKREGGKGRIEVGCAVLKRANFSEKQVSTTSGIKRWVSPGNKSRLRCDHSQKNGGLWTDAGCCWHTPCVGCWAEMFALVPHDKMLQTSSYLALLLSCGVFSSESCSSLKGDTCRNKRAFSDSSQIVDSKKKVTF